MNDCCQKNRKIVEEKPSLILYECKVCGKRWWRAKAESGGYG